MKTAKTLKTIFVLTAVLTPLTYIYAEDLDSGNYKIVGATANSGGGLVDSSNYSLIGSEGEISADPRNYSTNYQLHQDPSANFTAAIPSIECFETITDGATNCTSGPEDLLTGGMVAICGAGGCYNKARFEISGATRTPTTNTVAHFGLEQESGTGAYILDTSGNNHHGTPSGTTYIEDGIINSARNFDGNDYIEANEQLISSYPFTLSAWVRTSTTSTSSTKMAFTMVDRSSTWVQYGIGLTTDNKPRLFARSTGTSDNQYYSDTAINDGKWHLLVGVFNSETDKKLYVDGEYEGSLTTYSTYGSGVDRWSIGRFGDSSPGQYFPGDIDDVIVSKNAWSEADVKEAYEYGTRERSNPSDTLYMIQISTDNFVSDIKCLDGSTFRPKNLSLCGANDFRTESQWEAEDFNVQGLNSSTQYYLRATALHGDFTQSDFSQSSSATTAGGTLEFDIDIATSSGTTTESASPYSISFSGAYELVGGSAAITAPNLIWLDIESSSSGGVAILQHGDNGGLYSPTTTQTITSATANLDNVTSGFGLQSFYIDYDNSSFYGDITATTNYSGSLNNVGIVDTSNSKIYDGDGPIVDGRVGIEVIAKPGTDKTSATDYSENIHFILVPRY